ncbi:kinase-like domain-containing protein [Lyophyllum atratum]|nr:kinase-like domain-containing protein [Lyophyllum atratum]
MEQARSASRLALLVPRATSRTNAVSRFSRALLAPEVPRTDVGEGTQNSAWAPRPPAGDVYRLLAEFFPEHDLDNPHVGLDSEGSSAAASEGATATSRSGLGPAEGTQSQTKRPITTRITSQSIRAVQDSSFSGVPFEWALGALIGRGTYGYVYFALDTTDQKIIAVKQIDIPRTTNAQQSIIVNSLKIQRSKMEDLHHPNIVQSFGFAETKDFEERSHKLSIFLEYIPGGSIRSALAQYGKFNEDVTKSFTGQILAGLEYIHSKGIIHHDLKADNILVNMSGECKLSDYGLWKRTEEDIGGAIPGMKSVFWMAPEVYNGRKDGHNFKIDIWSVGCVTLEMWTGMRPWNGEEIMGVMYKLRLSKQPPVPVNVVLSELADGFRKECFMINPDERPTATELREHSYLALPPDWSFTDFQ